MSEVIDLKESIAQKSGSALRTTPEQALRLALESVLKTHPGPNVCLIVTGDKNSCEFNLTLYNAGLTYPEALGWLEAARDKLLADWRE